MKKQHFLHTTIWFVQEKCCIFKVLCHNGLGFDVQSFAVHIAVYGVFFLVLVSFQAVSTRS